MWSNTCTFSVDPQVRAAALHAQSLRGAAINRAVRRIARALRAVSLHSLLERATPTAARLASR